MGQDDPARGVTDRRYDRRLLAAWERFVEGAELASGVVRDVVGHPGCGAVPRTSTRRWARAGTRSGTGIDGFAAAAPESGSRPAVRDDAGIRSAVGVGHMMILTDPTGVILQSEGDAGTLEAALDVRPPRVRTGTSYGAAPTPSARRCPSAGPYASTVGSTSAPASKPWTCSATAVRDPRAANCSVWWTFQAAQEFQSPFAGLAVSSAARIESGCRPRLRVAAAPSGVGTRKPVQGGGWSLRSTQQGAPDGGRCARPCFAWPRRG